MPEPVIVATARSPIGRAFKGSLKELRSDDLAATIVQAALDKVPQLDPHDIDDLMLGCGLPGGEQGYNMGRVVAVLLGYDFIPGTTITRYCSSSLQTTRMAAHAIRAGEGDAFISAGVEMVSRFVKGNSDTSPDTMNPRLEAARARTAELALGGSAWSDPRADAALPDIYISMGQTAENVAQLHALTREEQDEFACRSQNNAERSIADGFFAREITPVTTPDGTLVSQDDTPRAGTTMETLAGADSVRRHPGRLQRRGAVARDRRTGDEVIAEQYGDHPAHVVTLLPAGQTAAEHQVVDVVRVELGHLVQCGLHDRGGEVVGAQLLERAFESTADGGAGGGDDDRLRHGGLLGQTRRRGSRYWAAAERGSVGCRDARTGRPRHGPLSPLRRGLCL